MWVQEGMWHCGSAVVVRQVVERATEYRTPLYLCFMDLTKAYDSVNRLAMKAILKEYGVPK